MNNTKYCNFYNNFILEYNTFQKTQKRIDKCKTINNKLWECIDKKNDIYNCGKEYYYFINCINSIDNIN